MFILSFIYRQIKVKEVSKENLINIEGIEKMNIPIESFYSKSKKYGISGILRTKNGGKFLKEVIESCIEGVDELVIINNLSTDNTKKIIFDLQQKYLKKIRYYEYNFEIQRKEDMEGNSLHSLAYFYNWCFSKAKYSIVGKIDDDGLFIKDIFNKQTKYYKNKKSFFQSFIYGYYWGLNFFEKDKKIGILKGNPYSGKYGDIGFFQISKKTYFMQNGNTEVFINNKFYIDLGFSYLHLKYFKEENGLKYAPKYLKKYFLNLLKTSKIENVNKYTKKISNNQAEKIIKNIITNKQ